MTPGRTKAEEVLSVMNDIADDLLLEAGEAAVEEFWRHMDDHFRGRAMRFWFRRLAEGGIEWPNAPAWRSRDSHVMDAAAAIPLDTYGTSRLPGFDEPPVPNSACSTATAGTADRPTVPADSSSGSPPG